MTDEERAAYGHRLQELLLEHGYKAPRKGSLAVDVRVIEQVLGVSNTMARNYVQGVSIPDKTKSKKLAQYFGVSPLWLEYGDGSKHGSMPVVLNEELLADILVVLRRVIEEKNLNLPRHLYSDWVIKIYRECMEQFPNYKHDNHMEAEVYELILKGA